MASSVEFESDGKGGLLVYIDAAWRQETRAKQEEFAVGIARRWADLTGNPSAPVAFGDGHGTAFAIAVAQDRDGQPRVFFLPPESQ